MRVITERCIKFPSCLSINWGLRTTYWCAGGKSNRVSNGPLEKSRPQVTDYIWVVIWLRDGWTAPDESVTEVWQNTEKEVARPVTDFSRLRTQSCGGMEEFKITSTAWSALCFTSSCLHQLRVDGETEKGKFPPDPTESDFIIAGPSVGFMPMHHEVMAG